MGIIIIIMLIRFQWVRRMADRSTFHRLWDSNQRPSNYWPNAFNLQATQVLVERREILFLFYNFVSHYIFFLIFRAEKYSGLMVVTTAVQNGVCGILRGLPRGVVTEGRYVLQHWLPLLGIHELGTPTWIAPSGGN